MRILVVEDEPAVAGHIARSLEAAGFLVEKAADGEDAWFRGDTEDYAAVVLDLGLPRIDGVTVLKRWREAGRTMPVVVLTARGSWKERVEGINAGADDYLGKPFEPEELVARLRAVLRRTAGLATPDITVGPVRLDPRSMEVRVEGVPVPLSPLEYRALSLLLHRKGSIVSFRELYEHVYGPEEPSSNTLETLVGRLRRKLGVPLIETRRGAGYMVRGEEA
ncbi:MAG: response regulator transcription factor [Parvibaculaceae bacterium]